MQENGNGTTAVETPLRLHRLEISNFMRISALTIDCQGKSVIISGPNASGKTTAVNAIWAAVGGITQKDMPEPIRRGAKVARVKTDLGEIIISRSWTEKGTKLEVKGADGHKFEDQKELINSLLGKYALNITAFLRRREQDQVDDVLEIHGVQPPVERVREITGDAFTARPGESADGYLARLSADETGLFFVRRLEAGRVKDQKHMARLEQEQVVSKLGGPLGPGEEAQTPSVLLREIAALSQKDAERRALKDAYAKAQGDFVLASGKLLRLIAELEEVEKKVAELEARIDKGREVCLDLGDEARAALEAIEVMPDPGPRLGQLQSQVADLERTNAQRSKRQYACEQLERLSKENDAAGAQHERADIILDNLRNLRLHLLDDVDLGVDELSVGNGELLLHGVSFKQASQAERIKTAIAVAMRQNPRLRLIRLDDAEHMDQESRAMVFRLAEEHDFQVIMTMVKDQADLSVEIVEAVQ